MSESIEEIIDTFGSNRSVGIETTNKSSSRGLTFHKTYNYNGHVYSPPPPTIDQGQTGVCVFIKTSHRDGDPVGVLSYHFGNTQISLLVSNPSDHKKYIIECALYVPDKPTLPDNNLYNEMYTKQTETPSFIKTALGKGNSPQYIKKKDIGVYVSATMSPQQNVILKIDIRDA